MWHLCGTCVALFSAKCGTDLLRGALLARFVLIMRINAQRHINRGVSCEILNLLDIQPAFKKPEELTLFGGIFSNMEIQRAVSMI